MALARAYAGDAVTNMMSVGGTQQVMLRVKVAEINRSMLKSMGFNLDVDDTTGGDFIFGIGQGTAQLENGIGNVVRSPVGTTFSGLTSLFGLDILGSLDLALLRGLREQPQKYPRGWTFEPPM